MTERLFNRRVINRPKLDFSLVHLKSEVRLGLTIIDLPWHQIATSTQVDLLLLLLLLLHLLPHLQV